MGHRESGSIQAWLCRFARCTVLQGAVSRPSCSSRKRAGSALTLEDLCYWDCPAFEHLLSVHTPVVAAKEVCLSSSQPLVLHHRRQRQCRQHHHAR